MTSVSYDEIFELFMGNVEDNKLLSLNISDAYAVMKDYLHKTLGATYVRELFSSASLDDEVQELSFEMALPQDDESDKDFVITAIGKWMVYEWLQRQVNSVLNTKQMFGGKESSFYSQANHIAELRAMRDESYCDARKFIMDKGSFYNSYLNGGS